MAKEIDHWVGAWLRKARHDIETARRAFHHTEPLTDTTVYHCQQAAEKALKAVLIQYGESVFKTHDLVALLTKCANHAPVFSEWLEVAATLTPYATAFRYPSDDPDPLPTDAEQAMRMAIELVDFVENQLLAEKQVIPALKGECPDASCKNL